jgi:hypothetical protein
MSIGDRKGNVMKQYIVDAFTDKPFSGNPAAVCIMDSWPSEESMMKLAMGCHQPVCLHCPSGRFYHERLD